MAKKLPLILSRTLTLLLLLGTLFFSYIEGKKLNNARPLINNPEDSDVIKIDEDCHRFFLKKLEQGFGIKRKNLVLEKEASSRTVDIKITATDKAEFDELTEKLDDLTYKTYVSLDLMEVESISLVLAGEKKRCFYASPYLPYEPTFNTAAVSEIDLLEQNLKKPLPSLLKTARRYFLVQVKKDLDKYLRNEPDNLEILVYRIAVKQELGEDTISDIEALPGMMKGVSAKAVARAQRIKDILLAQSDTTNNLRTPKPQLRDLEDNLSRSWFRHMLAARQKKNSGDEEAFLKYLNLADKDSSGAMDMLIIFFAIAIAAIVYSCFLLKKGGKAKADKFRLDWQDRGVKSKEAYGLWKPWAIGILYLLFGFFTILAMDALVPSFYDDAKKLLIAYFMPFDLSVTMMLEEIVLLLPLAVLTWLFVARKTSPIDFFQIKTRTADYDLKEMTQIAIICLAISISFTLISLLLSIHFFYPPEDAYEHSIAILSESNSIPSLLLLFVSIAIIPPIFEEAFFRGVIYRGLRRNWNVIPSTVFTSLVFALLHGQLIWWLLLDKFVFSVVVCLATEKTGTIVPAMICHFLMNSMIVLLIIFFGFR